ncbi:hypothetical protein Pcinc_032243, partial [Petrolisthes cinctipes]
MGGRGRKTQLAQHARFPRLDTNRRDGVECPDPPDQAQSNPTLLSPAHA